jgi:hypothetical protein
MVAEFSGVKNRDPHPTKATRKLDASGRVPHLLVGSPTDAAGATLVPQGRFSALCLMPGRRRAMPQLVADAVSPPPIWLSSGATSRAGAERQEPHAAGLMP